MPIVHQIPIAVTSLNYNIDADLDLGPAHGLHTDYLQTSTILNPIELRPGAGRMCHQDDTHEITLYGGRFIAGKGAIVSISGADSGGGIQLKCPNAAKNGNIIVLETTGVTDTPVISAVDHRIINVLDPVGAQDAATKNYCDTKATLIDWALYTPVWTWSVAPGSPTANGRWTQIGKTVFWEDMYQSADSNGGYLQTVSLPKTSTGIATASSIAFIYNTNAYAALTAPGYISSGTPTVFTMATFPATIDGQFVGVYISGFYEVTT